MYLNFFSWLPLPLRIAIVAVLGVLLIVLIARVVSRVLEALPFV